MPELINCPKCERKLSVGDELYGQAVKCPACGLLFTAPDPTRSTAVTTEPPSVPIVEPLLMHGIGLGVERPADPVEREGWQRVRTGLNLILASIFTAMGISLLAGCGGAFAAGNARAAAARQGEKDQAFKEAMESIKPILFLAAVGGLVSQALLLGGYWSCRIAPAPSEASGVATAAFILALGGLFLNGPRTIDTLTGRVPIPANPFQFDKDALNVFTILGSVAGMAAVVCFLFFLKKVALAIGNPGLARSVGLLIGLGVVVVLVAVCMFGVLATAGEQLADVQAGRRGAGFGSTLALGLGLGCLYGVLFLVGLVWYLVVLFQARNSIARFVDGRTWPAAFSGRFSR
jgi:hypothetical protein